MAGAAGLLIIAPFFNLTPDSIPILVWTFGASLVINLLITVGGEFGTPHASQVAAMAAHIITHGRYKNHYRFSLIIGGLMPLAIAAVTASPLALAIAGVLSLVGLFFLRMGVCDGTAGSSE